ncbi:MAG TPA: hypothetical protein VKN73_03530, partial [Desulfosalsimonadaceae bacterium]|nr:hypothetical protein [Desulfosalsimonadaceae bacterium]
QVLQADNEQPGLATWNDHGPGPHGYTSTEQREKPAHVACIRERTKNNGQDRFDNPMTILKITKQLLLIKRIMLLC